MSQEQIKHITNTKAVIGNPLVEAKYKLSATEQKVLHMLIAQIDFNDIDLKHYSFNVSDFMSIFGTNYVRLTKNSLSILLHSKILINKEKSIFETNWLSSAEYFDGGRIELEFSNKLKPYLLQLKKEFTKYNIDEINKFNSKFAIRLYLLMKQYLPLRERIIDVEELKDILQVTNIYPHYRNFKQKVLSVGIKEINVISDLQVNFSEIKKGRKIDKIKFTITPKNNNINIKNREQVEEQEKLDIDDLVDQLREIISENLKTREYKTLLQVANNDIELIQEKYEMSKKQNKNIESLVGWLIKAIEENYSEPIKKQKITQFNEIEQRKYNYDELEKQLLNINE